LKTKHSCTAKTAEKKKEKIKIAQLGKLWEKKIDEVLSIKQVLCLTLKNIYIAEAIAYQKNHVRPRKLPNSSPPPPPPPLLKI